MLKETYIGIFHLFIHEKLKEQTITSLDNIITRSKVIETLYKNNIPIRFHPLFIEEMEKFKLIKRINKQKIKVLGVEETKSR